MQITSTSEGLQAQREYIEKLETEGFDWGILVGDAFVRGMRDIGYKSTSFALAELIDNAVQASAERIDIVFGFDGGNTPTKLAIVDNGHGMEQQMVRASLIWGAGTRAENRDGFGKYGYGLPSASVSQCRRVTVYSKTPDGEWHRAYLDIDEIKRGEWTKGHQIETPEAVAEEPPDFVIDFLKKQKRWSKFKHGTVIVWDNLDRVRPKRRETLLANLLTDLGVIYRNYLTDTPVTVDGVAVEPCDPLFLTEGFRYYDLDEDRAIELPPAVVEVKEKGSDEVLGRMRVRFARMPATFFRKPDAKHTHKPGKKAMNERLDIADANNGIIFLREGRQIDVVRPPRSLASFNATTDRFWAIEVDFDVTLDDEFSITTSKQQVKPSERVWDMLKDKAKIFTAIGAMRKEYAKDAAQVRQQVEDARDGKKASVEAIEAAKKHRTTKRPKDTPERRREAEENLRQEAHRRANRAGLDPQAVERDLEARQQDHPYDVRTEELPGAPFFRCVQEGGQRVLYLNVAHRFYTELYTGPGSTSRLRAGLEVLLWALGEAEIEAEPDGERRQFYERERASVWSPYVEDALAYLAQIDLLASNEDDEAAA